MGGIFIAAGVASVGNGAYIVLRLQGRQTKVTAPGNFVTNTAYYLTGEIRRIDGATYPVEYTYNGLGNQAMMTTFKDADTPQQTSWSYNSRGQMIAKTYADNSSVTYTYNGDGQLLTRTWARGVVTTYTYDAAGRMTNQSYSDDTPSITTAYSFLNQPLTVTDAAGTRTLTYNSQSLLENETIPGIMDNMGNSYSYDAYGRRILRQLNTNGAAQAVSGIAYDVKGRVASVGNGTDTLRYAYRPGLNQLETATWRNSQDAVLNSRTYAYDAYHRLTGINLNNASEVAYTLNDRDQRTAASYAVGGAWSYSYDEKSQVTGATGNNTTFSYAYDGIGNRLTAAEGSDTWSYTSNLLNQYTAINSDQPTYDADGNMLTTGDGWFYTWNGENRLIRAESSDTLVEMAYDYMGRRVEKKVSSKGLLSFYNWNVDKHYKFAYDDYKLIAVYDAANNNALLMTFTWQPESVGLDVPVSMTYDGNTYYYVTDGNKNVTGLLDQAGNRVAEYVYGPFGQLLGAEGELAEVNPFRFSSEYADDETGLVYYNYRYYNAKLGRWIKRDLAQEEGSINLYGVLENNVLNEYDYCGLLSKNKCECSYRRALEIFYDYISGINSSKAFNQFRGFDCDEGSFGLLRRLRNDPVAQLGFVYKKLRRGKFINQAKRIYVGPSEFIQLPSEPPSLHNPPKQIWLRFIRLHSIVLLTPNDECQGYDFEKLILDFLEQSIYRPQKFFDEFYLDVDFDKAGYYKVNPPPYSDKLIPNQTEPYYRNFKLQEMVHGLTGNAFR